ncbi:COP9 signalosome complex subunita [Sesamum angolense]|uniref:COP9 signalosome complex subunit 6 n=1 Tax=Sesamum angolense TaxID=2727404 RepID=A0AAE1W574_9LAMI|nr:COP9 signalosome complex subunita [Sesamum angolense]
MASSSSSGLTFKLHPLVIVNISDHYTRVKSQSLPPHSAADASSLPPPPPPRVFGCVIGVQRGRTVEIFNSFELLYDPTTHSLDRAFLEKKQELYKKVFPHFYILGWYSTGSDAQESDMISQSCEFFILSYLIFVEQFSDFTRTVIPDNQVVFAYLTVEAERISVDHVAHLKPSDGGSAALNVNPVLIYSSAIKMLNSRIRVLHHYLLAMQKGDIPCENSLLRQVSSLLRRLPAIESEKFQDDFLMEYNDTLLITYLAMFTNCSSTMNELVDKFNTAYDRQGRRGGRTAFI